MTSISVTQARARLYELVKEAESTHEPVQITSKHGNVMLVTEEDWRSIQETLHLLSISGMRESIRQGMKEPLAKTSKKLRW